MKKKHCICTVSWFIAAVVLIIVALVVQFSIITSVFKQNLIIKNGSMQYKNWYEPEVPVYFQWFVFNLTNMENVAAKIEKPKFTQLGPYTYREHRVKTHIVWHDNGTVTYKNLRWYTFVPEKSNGSENDTVISVNLPYVTVAEALIQEYAFMKDIFDYLAKHYGESLYRNYTVHQLLWGYHDPMMTEAKKFLPQMFYTDFVGLYAGKNYTDDGIWTVSTGEKNLSTVGQAQFYNGSKYLNFWSTQYANMVNGTDGTIGPPHMNKDETVYFFVPDICRSLYATYMEDEKTSEGITLYRLSSPRRELLDASNNPDNAGFCTPPGNCVLGDGMMNITSCQILDGFNIPVIASLPHFLYADPKYIAKVEGLKPVESEHRTDVCVEPKTGIVMRVAKRLQINIYLRNISFITPMANIDEIIFPVAWLNESANIDEPNQEKYLSLMSLMNGATIVCYVLYGIGAAVCVVSAGFFFYLLSQNERTGERKPLLSGRSETAEPHKIGGGGEGDSSGASTSSAGSDVKT